jgi:2-polyprenyl-6-methoxyphenol hydroxylase-like FAD-dependent oxidoreductase
MMSGLDVLISGAGIAGPTVAFFLARAGARITIVEKAPELRSGGQNVDIRGVGLTVLRRMGLEAAVLRRTTEEEGVAFVDASDRSWAKFPVGHNGEKLSLTAEVEIVRGDLAKIFHEATREDVKYVFGNSIEHMVEQNDKVHVSFKDKSKQEFDLVVAADGLGSPTHTLIFGDKQKTAIRSLGQYGAWFTIPREESDGMWARWYNAPGRRMILLRPDTKLEEGEPSPFTRASIWYCGKSAKQLGNSKLSVQEQKALLHNIFRDAGWEAPRVLAGMEAADDFYIQEVAQVKREDSWSRGRMAVVGDAACCPSPLSGMGTTVAIVGAYILAGEIARNPRDPHAAFASYERLMRPFAAMAQKLAPGVPHVINPETAWGIWIMYWFLSFVCWTGLPAVLGRYAGPPVGGIVLPEYEVKAAGGN